MATTYVIFFITIIAFYYFCKLIMKRSRTLEKFQDAASTASTQAPLPANATNNIASANTAVNAISAGEKVTSDTGKKEEKKEKKDDKDKKPKEEKTPAESGLVFGYLPENIKPTKLEYKLDPNTIYGGSTISLSSKNLYLGMNEKNPLLPVFLETLGTFKPYEYSTVKVHIKNDDFNATAALDDIVFDNIKPQPIFCNKTVVCFTIKYLQDNYFLQYIPNTSTFYLTNKPSYFNIINAMDINTEREVKYDDSILLRCLDNSELLLIYDSFIVTESNKSSTFNIRKAESQDICLNFNKSNVDLKKFNTQYIDPQQVATLQNANKVEIDRYLAELKKTSAGTINSIKANLVLLEQKRSNLISKTQLGIEQKKLEYKNIIDKEKEKVDKEIKTYQEQMAKELQDYKVKVSETKGKQWENEISKFRKDIEQKCRAL